MNSRQRCLSFLFSGVWSLRPVSELHVFHQSSSCTLLCWEVDECLEQTWFEKLEFQLKTNSLHPKGGKPRSSHMAHCSPAQCSVCFSPDFIIYRQMSRNRNNHMTQLCHLWVDAQRTLVSTHHRDSCTPALIEPLFTTGNMGMNPTFSRWMHV